MYCNLEINIKTNNTWLRRKNMHKSFFLKYVKHMQFVKKAIHMQNRRHDPVRSRCRNARSYYCFLGRFK